MPGNFSPYIDIYRLNRLAVTGLTKRVVLNVHDDDDGVRWVDIEPPDGSFRYLHLPLAQLLSLAGSVALDREREEETGSP